MLARTQALTEIQKLAIEHRVKEGGLPYLVEAVIKKSTYEDGKIKFKNEDGTTLIIANREASTNDIIKEMQEKEIKSGISVLFDTAPQKSGASGLTGGSLVEGAIPRGNTFGE